MTVTVKRNVTGAVTTSSIGSIDIQTACLLSGTRVATPTGTVAVEELSIWSVVMLQPMGRVGDDLPPAVPTTVVRVIATPVAYDHKTVRVPAGSLGGGVPSRDVVVSQGHPVLHEDVHYDAGRLVGVVPGVAHVSADDVRDLTAAGLATMFGIMCEEEGALVVEGGMLAHGIPPASASHGLGGERAGTSHTNLLVIDDGRVWKRNDGTTARHPGDGSLHKIW
jgi:hypothetical protein